MAHICTERGKEDNLGWSQTVMLDFIHFHILLSLNLTIT